MTEIPPMPQPKVSNIATASHIELACEVITLRLYIAQLYTEMKQFQLLFSTLTGDAPARLQEAEERIADLRNRVFTLERANDERNRRPPIS